jgi:hypothetical protein
MVVSKATGRKEQAYLFDKIFSATIFDILKRPSIKPEGLFNKIRGTILSQHYHFYFGCCATGGYLFPLIKRDVFNSKICLPAFIFFCKGSITVLP